MEMATLFPAPAPPPPPPPPPPLPPPPADRVWQASDPGLSDWSRVPGLMALPQVADALPAFLPVVPVHASRQLQIALDDCLDGMHRNAASSSSSSPPLIQSRKPVAGSSEIYVQSSQNPNTFRAVARREAKQLGMGRTAASSGRRQLARSSIRSAAVTVAAVEAAAIDSDVAALGAAALGESDRDIFELVAAAEGSRLLSYVVFFIFQGLLLGTSILSALFATQALGGDDATSGMEPGLRGLTLASAEFCLLGNLLRAANTYDRVVPDESEAKRRARSSFTNSAVAGVANLLAVACCLLGTVGFFSSEDNQEILLRFRAGFGFFAVCPAFFDMKQLVSPLLPVSAVLPLISMPALTSQEPLNQSERG